MSDKYTKLTSLLYDREIITLNEYKQLAELIEFSQSSTEKKYETELFQNIANYLGEVFEQKFTFQKHFLSGGFAHTDLVKHNQTGQTYIMKYLHYSKTFVAEHKERFIREIINTLSIEHPNIPKLKHFGRSFLKENEEEYYYIMDYIEGKDFYTHIFEDETSDWLTMQSQLLHKYVDILDAMTFLHSQQIYHRDCTLPNMVYHIDDNKGYLIDLGLSKQFDDSIPVTSPNSSRGNPAYLAPESLTQGAYSIGTDIYTLGASLYSLLTKKYPHNFFSTDAQHVYERMRIWLQETQSSLNLDELDISRYRVFDPIIKKATAFHSSERYKNVEELLDAYATALKQV